MYQLIKRIVRDPDDHTHISLVYANRTQDEILLKNELDYLALTHPDQLRIYYVLDNPPSNNGGGVSSDYWSQGKGRLTSSMIKSNLPAPSPDTFVFVCGPDG